MKKWLIYLIIAIATTLLAIAILLGVASISKSSQQPIFLIIIFFVLLMISSFFYTAFVMEIRYGNIVYDKDHLRKKLTITTDCACLVLDENKQQITGEVIEKGRFLKKQKRSIDISYSSVNELYIEFTTKNALWLEFLLGDSSIFDFSSKYRDEIAICNVYLSLNNGEKYIIFKAMQYKIYDFFPLFPALVRNYLVPEVNDYSRGKLKGMKHMFRNSGCRQILI